MDDSVDNISYRGYDIKIYQDDMDESPLEWGTLCNFKALHGECGKALSNVEGMDEVEEKWEGTQYPRWESGGFGETMERNATCGECGRTIRAVYIFSCYLDNETEEEVVLEYQEEEELTERMNTGG